LDAQYGIDKIGDMGHEGQSMARAGQSEGGRGALLDKLYGPSSAGAGGSALDSALLGYHAGGRFGALEQKYKNFDQLLNNTVKTSQTIGGQAKNAADKAQIDWKAWVDAHKDQGTEPIATGPEPGSWEEAWKDQVTNGTVKKDWNSQEEAQNFADRLHRAYGKNFKITPFTGLLGNTYYVVESE
jgi:hypothetical protein